MNFIKKWWTRLWSTPLTCPRDCEQHKKPTPNDRRKLCVCLKPATLEHGRYPWTYGLCHEHEEIRNWQGWTRREQPDGSYDIRQLFLCNNRRHPSHYVTYQAGQCFVCKDLDQVEAVRQAVRDTASKIQGVY